MKVLDIFEKPGENCNILRICIKNLKDFNKSMNKFVCVCNYQISNVKNEMQSHYLLLKSLESKLLPSKNLNFTRTNDLDEILAARWSAGPSIQQLELLSNLIDYILNSVESSTLGML